MLNYMKIVHIVLKIAVIEKYLNSCLNGLTHARNLDYRNKIKICANTWSPMAYFIYFFYLIVHWLYFMWVDWNVHT